MTPPYPPPRCSERSPEWWARYDRACELDHERELATSPAAVLPGLFLWIFAAALAQWHWWPAQIVAPALAILGVVLMVGIYISGCRLPKGDWPPYEEEKPIGRRPVPPPPYTSAP